MKLQNCINLVQQLLENKVKYSDPKLQHYYIQGLLIGFISKQIHSDSKILDDFKKLINNK